MKKPTLILSLLLLTNLSMTALAQTDIQMDGSQQPAPTRTRKKTVKYNEATNEVVEAPSQESPSPVYIVNSPKYASVPAVQEQPNTVIEASSLRESKADQLRKSRQDMEVQTEQKIVEKLEEARIQDEKARADRLFGASLAAPTPTPTPAPTPYPIAPPPPAPQAQQVAPVVVVEREAEQHEDVDNGASIREEVKKQLDEAKVEENKSSYYIGALVGVSEIPDASSVRSSGSGGVTIGTVTPEGWVAEGTFLYSTYDLGSLTPFTGNYQFPPYETLTQYSFQAGAKYQFLSGKLRPNVGVLASYDYRKYNNSQYSGYVNGNPTSNAVDLGLSAGLDLMITKNFSLGVDFKYFFNIAYNTNSDYQNIFSTNQYNQGYSPLEKLDYYTATVAGKINF